MIEDPFVNQRTNKIFSNIVIRDKGRPLFLQCSLMSIKKQMTKKYTANNQNKRKTSFQKDLKKIPSFE